jgi:hypothetical protein
LLFTCLNFFFLDRDVEACAAAHGDKHINKMQLEYAQIASTVVHLVNPALAPGLQVYKPTHKHHPVVKWAAQSRAHVMWIIDLGIALDKEKAKRAVIAKQLGKKWSATHKSQAVLQMLKEKMFDALHFEQGDTWSDPPACMPDCLKQADVVESYRLYYVGPKMQVLGLAWKPYADEPSFVEPSRKRLREMPGVEKYIQGEIQKRAKSLRDFAHSRSDLAQ